MSTLERAIALAADRHAGQVDKAGQPYILHPLRVMMKVTGEPERMAAVMHDLLEDTPTTADELTGLGFPPEVVHAVIALTKVPGESYEEFVARAKLDPIARVVKLADLEDNMDPGRLREMTDKDRERMEKYRRARESLL